MSYESLRPLFFLPALVFLTPLVVALVTLFAYALRPAWSGLDRTPRTRSWTAFVAPFVVLVVASVAASAVVPTWRMQTDEERDEFVSTLCARHQLCPLVGNEMNKLRIPLGPLNRYCMIACRAVTPDPRAVMVTLLVFHVLAAVWLARLADTLVGAPGGILAGAAFAFDPTLLDAYAQPSNGAWAPLALVGTLWGLTRWARGDGGVPFVAMITAFACAAQFHGTSLAYVPVIAVVAWWMRPRTPRWSLAVAAAVVLAMYSTWIYFEFDTDFASVAAFGIAWAVQGGAASAPRSLTERLTGPLVTLGPVWWLAVPGVIVAAVYAFTDRPRRREIGAVAVAMGVPWLLVTVGTVLAGSNWVDRYDMPWIPGAALAASMVLLVRARLPSVLAWRGLLAVSAVVTLVDARHTLTELGPDRGSRMQRARGALWLDESIRALRLLGRRGLHVGDIETRIHGALWNRWKGAHLYLGHWLLPSGAADTSSAAVHVQFGECAPAGGAAWVEPLGATAGVPRVMIGYVPEIAPPVLTVSFANGEHVTETGLVPLFKGWTSWGDTLVQAAVDPRLAPPREAQALAARVRDADFRDWQLDTTLAPGTADRELVVVAGRGCTATLRVEGVAREPLVVDETEQATSWRYVVHGAERATGRLHIAAVVTSPEQRMFPGMLDLYDGPPLPCAAAAAARAR